MTVEQLQAFVSKERQASREEAMLTSMLADDALADRGDAIVGLKMVCAANGEVSLRCDRNESRFRAGSRLEFRSSTSRWTGTLIDLADEGRELHVRASCSFNPNEKWVAVEQDVDMTPLIRQCLRKIQPGAPGYFYFRILAGMGYPTKPKPSTNHSQFISNVIGEGEVALDSSQLSVVTRCLELPPLFGCQGPPGTGKSQTLAVVAECLARMGKRVVVLAQTHQAVNNALSVIHRTFPKRHVVKVGDELRRESLDDDIECQLLRDAVKSVPPKLSSEMITGITFVSALHHLALRTSGLAPNVVLIDEAGQLALAQGCLAGLMGAGSVLLFGDDAQMPPVFASDVMDDPLAVSLFQRLRAVQPESVTMLDKTYRMNESLTEIISDNFYANATSKLHSSEGARDQKFELELPEGVNPLIASALSSDSSLVWFQTRASGCRQANAEEAMFISEVVATVLRAGLDSDRVAVVTPFRRQAALIRRKLQALFPKMVRLPIVDTVERVQGLTVDLILISATTSDPEFASMLGSFLFSPNRLNVAISRARQKAIVAMSPTVLTAVPSQYSGYLGLKKYKAVLEKAALLP